MVNPALNMIAACAALVATTGQLVSAWQSRLSASDVEIANLALDEDASIKQPSQTSERRIARSTDGLFHVRGHASGGAVGFVVDSGASIVVLTQSDAKRLRVSSHTDASASIRTLTGLTSMRRGRIASLTVAGVQLNNVDVAIVDDGLGVSLLGQNVITRVGRVTIDGDWLTIQPAKGDLASG